MGAGIEKGIGRAFGTFGELLQGVLPTGRNFLVTLPINLHATAHFSNKNGSALSINPPHKQKSFTLARRILEHFKLPIEGELYIKSDIPEGKGMASSSADLVATARSIANFYNFTMPRPVLEALMSEIEPSDGVMYDGCVSFYQREVILRSHLGNLPPMTIVGMDEGGEIDTIQFNQKPKMFTITEKNQYNLLLKSMEIAIRKQDINTIGNIATQSALMNQRLKVNPHLKQFIEMSKRISALGVVIAHSGTFIGVLIYNDDNDFERKLSLAKEYISELSDQLVIVETFSEANNSSTHSERLATARA